MSHMMCVITAQIMHMYLDVQVYTCVLQSDFKDFASFFFFLDE